MSIAPETTLFYKEDAQAIEFSFGLCFWYFGHRWDRRRRSLKWNERRWNKWKWNG